MHAKGIFVNEEQFIVGGSSDKPLEIIKVQIANATSCLASEIKVEGRLTDGVPHLTKVGALNVDRKQAVMGIGVHEKPSKKALNKIDEIPAIDMFVFLAF
nr:D-3-phosphoglycerate dehydrogenase 1, chloroplastic-like [Tanacetum cinerariifolium]